MAVSVNRYLTLFLLLLAATACYAIGFIAGFWLLIAVGVVFELTFWVKLLFELRRRD